MQLTIDNALAVIRTMVEAHFQESEYDGMYRKSKYLSDTDHETIDEFMEEMKDTFVSEFGED